MGRNTVSDRAVITTPTPQVSHSTMLLDANLRLIRRIEWQRAVTMMLVGSVNVLAPYMRATTAGVLQPVMVRSPSTEVVLPYIVSLARYIHDPYSQFLQAGTDQASTRAILARDGHVCAYCGGRATTKDHVLPKSRGGSSGWTNLVAACVTCNQRKADRTPNEAGMVLLWEPSRYDGFSEDLQAEIWAYLAQVAGMEPTPTTR